MHNKLLAAIDRRAAIESTLSSFPDDVEPEEFKDLDWATNEAELRERIIRLRGLQLRISKSVNDEPDERIFERLAKRQRRLESRLADILPLVLKATASALDSQTTYFTPEEASDFTIQLQQRLFGIGVQLRDQLTGFEVLRIIEKGPADREGTLHNGDLIIAVDGESVIGLDIIDVVRQIRGKVLTPVTLTILRSDEQLTVEITRDEVVLEETRFETFVEPYGDGVIGYLALHSFYQDARHSSAFDLKREIGKLKEKYNLKGLVLDLRHNGGGLLPQAVAVTSLFITKGIVVSVKNEHGKIQHLRDTLPHITWDGPLVVLVSRGTASAAEIVAGTLQDYGRAIIVGDESTFGKGTFQSSTIDAIGGMRIDPKGEHKVTRGIYYTVSGRSPQLTGITPDIIAPGLLSELEIGERFSKFPLENDQIAPHFVDDLTDIPVFHRSNFRNTYLFDLQQPLTLYTDHLETLKANSEIRRANHPDFEEWTYDHQRQEGLDVMKDLVLLLQAA